MDVLEIIKKRRSIREFQEKTIPKEVVDKLAEAIIWAPSAGNLQSRKFYFVFNQKVKKELVSAALGQNFISQAPLVVVGCADDKVFKQYGDRGKDLYAICDVANSIENLMLLAFEQGLGSVWVGKFEEKEVTKILDLPKNLRPVAVIPIGYPAEKPEAPPRLSKEEIIKFVK
jgi:nitroreductase